MYTPPPTHKKQTIKQVLIYVLMTLSVVTIVFLLILFMLGYRFNRSAGTIEQGGLVQFNSIPTGAKITINTASPSATTPTKATLPPGQHSITMARDGYDTWRKTVDLKRGSILWLNYARLIPTNLVVENIANLPAITSSEASPNRELYALTTEKNTPTITLYDIGSDVPVSQVLTLPVEAYTKPEDATTESFHVSAWNSSNRYLLVEHRYDKKIEWIVADTEDIEKTKNISTVFDVSLTSVQFSPADSNILYALMNGDVRKVDIEAATISAPLVRNVAEFSIYDRSTVVYATLVDPVTKSRSVGYRNDGASIPREIRSFTDDGLAPLHISIDKYFNQPYIAIGYANSVEVLSGSLPRSDSDETLLLSSVAKVEASDAVNHLSMKTDGRFVVAQHGKSFSVYDIELQKTTTTPLRGTEVAPERELRWIDSYNVWSGLDGQIRFYEFDGTNQHDIMPIVPGQSPALTSNGRFLYAPTIDEKGVYHLSRVRLILQ